MNKHYKIGLVLSSIALLAGCSSKPSVSNLSASGSFWSDEQVAYLTNKDLANTSPYNGNMSMSSPKGYTLSFKSSGIKERHINIYKDEALSSLEASYVVKEDSFVFYNPELGSKYYWNVSDEKNTYVSETNSFEVEVNDIRGPRNLNIDGVENFRDIGGWGRFVDNKYVTYMKQGMIYRSGRFNEDKSDPMNVTISDKGLEEVNNHLKIKTEIDLRRSGNNETGKVTVSPLGEGVTYINLPMYYGGNNILTYKGTISGDSYEYDNPKAIKQFFDLLADEKNYPLDFHCSIGKDRTGCMAYLIEGLLGFDEEAMKRDYMFTNFANAGMCKIEDITTRYGQTIAEYSGETINEKVYNYLNAEIGVSKDNLDKIINLLGNK